MPNPLMQVDIDWNNDGRYSGPHDDITSDALAVSVARGRDNPWGRASAGQMQLTVRNHDDKYSPTNAASPLFRSLVPGRMARFHMRYPWDTFTDDNAPLASHSPDKPTDAGGWTEHSGSWRVDGPGDALSLSGTPAGIAYATMDFGTADAWVAVDFTRSAASDNAGLVLRADADGNYILIHTDGAAALRLQCGVQPGGRHTRQRGAPLDERRNQAHHRAPQGPGNLDHRRGQGPRRPAHVGDGLHQRLRAAQR